MYGVAVAPRASCPGPSVVGPVDDAAAPGATSHTAPADSSTTNSSSGPSPDRTEALLVRLVMVRVCWHRRRLAVG